MGYSDLFVGAVSIALGLAGLLAAATNASVCFRGNKVEEGPVEQIFENPTHPYTQALLAAVPKLSPVAAQTPSLAAGRYAR